MDIDPPHGPRKIAKKNQVSFPTELLEAIGVTVGDSVWVGVNPDRPTTLVVMTRAEYLAIFEAGWVRTKPARSE